MLTVINNSCSWWIRSCRIKYEGPVVLRSEGKKNFLVEFTDLPKMVNLYQAELLKAVVMVQYCRVELSVGPLLNELSAVP
jgi:hypothetical protein